MAAGDRFGGAGKARSRLPVESGVGAALWGGSDGEAPTSRFESVSMAEARRGIGSSSGPVTSAGYNGKDGGFVREQIYGCIRQLDSGSLTVRAFRTRLATLGVPIVPAVEKLLGDYTSTGRASFPHFVKAFEDYFMTATVADDAGRPAPHSFPGQREAEASGALYGRPRTGKARPDAPVAAQDHGNLLSWEGAADVTEEERKAMTRDGLRPAMKKRQDMYTGAVTKNIVTWDGPDPEGEDLIGARRPHRVSHRGRDKAMAERDAGNFLAWASGGFDHVPDAHVSGHVVDTHPDGTPMVRRKGRVPSAEVREHGSVPFGTHQDVVSPPPTNIPVRDTHSFRSSDWMRHPEDSSLLPRRGVLRK